MVEEVKNVKEAFRKVDGHNFILEGNKERAELIGKRAVYYCKEENVYVAVTDETIQGILVTKINEANAKREKCLTENTTKNPS